MDLILFIRLNLLFICFFTFKISLVSTAKIYETCEDTYDCPRFSNCSLINSISVKTCHCLPLYIPDERNEECHLIHSEFDFRCSSDNTCQLKPNLAGRDPNCPHQHDYHCIGGYCRCSEKCWKDLDCSDGTQRCDRKIRRCLCSNKYYFNSTTLFCEYDEDSCLVSNDCTKLGQRCDSKAKRCVCNEPKYKLDPKTNACYFDEWACDESIYEFQCKLAHQRCIKGFCECESTYILNSTSKTCEKDPKSCLKNADCKGFKNFCVNNQCKCARFYEWNNEYQRCDSIPKRIFNQIVLGIILFFAALFLLVIFVLICQNVRHSKTSLNDSFEANSGQSIPTNSRQTKPIPSAPPPYEDAVQTNFNR